METTTRMKKQWTPRPPSQDQPVGRKRVTRRRSFKSPERTPRPKSCGPRPSEVDFIETTAPTNNGENAKVDKELEEIFQGIFDRKLDKTLRKALRHFMKCVILLEVGYLDQVQQSKDIFTEIFKEHCALSLPELPKVAARLGDKKRFTESILIYEIAKTILHEKVENHETIASYVMEYMQDLEGLTKVMVNCAPKYRAVVRDYVVPLMHDSLQKLDKLENIDPEIRLSRYVCCCVFLGFTEWNLGGVDEAEAAWLQAITACRKFYGEDANKHCVLGSCYQNMGNFYAMSGQLQQAEGYLKLALDVFQVAEEYGSEVERQNDVKTCSEILAQLTSSSTSNASKGFPIL